MMAAAPSLACSLSNISADDCEDDRVCEETFGLGSSCEAGYCTEPAGCATGHDCRRSFGGGACVEGVCTIALPEGPSKACQLLEPSDLGARDLIGPDAPLLAGGLFALEDSADPQLAKAVQLAVREIGQSGLGDGRPLGLVFCDVGGPGNDLSGSDRRDRVQAAVDHLAGSLGVPFIVGPATSNDSLVALGRVLAQQYPTAIISPSATSPVLSSEPDRLSPSDPFGLFWRTAPSDVVQGKKLAGEVVGAYPISDPTIDRVAVIYLSDAYGEGLASVFQSSWGVGRTDLFPFDEGVDWDLLAASVETHFPDAMVMVAVDAADAISFIRAMTFAPGLAEKYLYLTDGSKDEAQLLNTALEVEVQNIIFNQVVGTAPATPSGPDFNLFRAAYENAFGLDPTGFSFVANAYDAAYVGAAGLVYAAETDARFDGRDVAAGLSRLVTGQVLSLGPSGWGAIKSALTTEPRTVDVVGVSGDLDFDPVVGEAAAPIEVWQPTTIGSLCAGAPPCFTRLVVLE